MKVEKSFTNKAVLMGDPHRHLHVTIDADEAEAQRVLEAINKVAKEMDMEED